METVLDLAYGNARLTDRPDLILRGVLELARAVDQDVPQSAESGTNAAALQQRLHTAVGPERHEEALETL
jgi:hypothetical protein